MVGRNLPGVKSMNIAAIKDIVGQVAPAYPVISIDLLGPMPMMRQLKLRCRFAGIL